MEEDSTTNNSTDFLETNVTTWNPEYLLKVMDVVFRNGLTNQSTKIPQPQNITLPLRDHQKAVIAAMIEKERVFTSGVEYKNAKTFANYGVLGDKVGSGKSLMVLGFLAHCKENGIAIQQTKSLYNKSSNHFFSIYETSNASTIMGPALIVVPHTLFRQWQTYCKSHSNLNVFAVKTIKDVSCTIDGIVASSSKDELKQKILSSDVVLVSNTLYNTMEAMIYSLKIRWSRMFIDEVDTIHVTGNSYCPNAAFTWFISASWPNFVLNGNYLRPALLQYYESHTNQFTPELGNWLRSELGIQSYHQYSHGPVGFGKQCWFRTKSNNWLRHFYTEHILRGLPVIYCNSQFLDESQQMPPIETSTIYCLQSSIQRAVSGIVSLEVRNMLHAGNVEGALEKLGVGADTPMNLIQAVTREKERDLDRLRKTLIFKEGIDYATPQAKEAALDSLRTKIASLESQLKGFHERVANLQIEECPICYDDPKLNNGVVTPCCHRIFCGTCILQSLARTMTCPMCRGNIQTKQLTQLVKETKSPKKKKSEETLLSKHKQLIKLLRENPTARVLVFSRYENPFVNLERDCDDEGISYHTLRGNKDVIASTIKSFEAGEKRVLFLPTESAGAGLNLISATHVILLHAMTPEEEKQVIGRAYRLGRTQPLNVIHLLHEGETVGV